MGIHPNTNISIDIYWWRGMYLEKCCTHRPSLLPIEWLSESSGLTPVSWQQQTGVGKLGKLGHLEEVKVVTRFP